MAETVVVACPTCGKKYKVGVEKLGKNFKCTGCQNPFVASVEPPVAPPPEIEAAVEEQTGSPPPMPPVSMGAIPQGSGETSGKPKTSGMAIASLICGILFCIPLASLLALIFGIIGINQTKENRAGGRGLAITGTVLGGLGLLLIPLSIAILLPALNQARFMATRIKSMANMKMIDMSIMQYQNTYQAYPPDLATLWKNDPSLNGMTFVNPATSDTPAASFSQLTTGGHLSYVYVGANTDTKNANAVLMYEDPAEQIGGGINILSADGSVVWHTTADAQKIIHSVAATP